MACALAAERVWIEKSRYADAERQYHERLVKLLKGNVSEQITETMESLPVEKTPEKTKKKNKKSIRKSQSPDDISEITTKVAAPKATPIPAAVTAKPKKQKKPKVAESEASSNNSISKDVSPSLVEENVVPSSEATEETKTKKKKVKKSKQKAAEKQEDISQQENIPPESALTENKNDSQDFVKKSKVFKNKGPSSNQCTLVSEIAKARQHIKNSLEKMDGIATLAATPASPDVVDRLAAIEKDNANLRKLVEDLKKVCLQSESRVKALESKLASLSLKPAENATPATPAKQSKSDDDDGVDLFASDSDEDDAEAAKIREERLAAYAAKKSKKPALIAKSSLVLDVKPWDDETDMKALEAEVRKITADGLLWGASKFAPVAFGITKLSISCVVEDDKVSIDWLTEEIEKLEDYVQSVDVAAFNKI